MTFAIFITLVLGLFVALLNILPSASAFPIQTGSAISYIIGIMKSFNLLFPITEILILTTITITFEIAVWTWHISWRVVKFIRGHSSG